LNCSVELECFNFFIYAVAVVFKLFKRSSTETVVYCKLFNKFNSTAKELRPTGKVGQSQRSVKVTVKGKV